LINTYENREWVKTEGLQGAVRYTLKGIEFTEEEIKEYIK